LRPAILHIYTKRREGLVEEEGKKREEEGVQVPIGKNFKS
jgi:hypothetical protein